VVAVAGSFSSSESDKVLGLGTRKVDGLGCPEEGMKRHSLSDSPSNSVVGLGMRRMVVGAGLELGAVRFLWKGRLQNWRKVRGCLFTVDIVALV
jgi:hypothetical protein